MRSHTIQLQDDIYHTKRWSSFKLKTLRDRENLKKTLRKEKARGNPQTSMNQRSHFEHYKTLYPTELF